MSLVVYHPENVEIIPSFVLIDKINFFNTEPYKKSGTFENLLLRDFVNFLSLSTSKYMSIEENLLGLQNIKLDKIKPYIKYLSYLREKADEVSDDYFENLLIRIYRVLCMMCLNYINYKDSDKPISLLDLSFPIFTEGFVSYNNNSRCITRQYILEKGVLKIGNVLMLPGDYLVFDNSMINIIESKTQGRTACGKIDFVEMKKEDALSVDENLVKKVIIDNELTRKKYTRLVINAYYPNRDITSLLMCSNKYDESNPLVSCIGTIKINTSNSDLEGRIDGFYKMIDLIYSYSGNSRIDINNYDYCCKELQEAVNHHIEFIENMANHRFNIYYGMDYWGEQYALFKDILNYKV